VEQIREMFAAAGLSKRAWRYVTRYGARVFKLPWAMAAGQSLADVAIEYLRVLDEAGLPPPPPPAVLSAWLRIYVARGADRVSFRWGRCGVPRDVLAIALGQADRQRRSAGLAEFVDAFLGVMQWGGRNDAHRGQESTARRLAVAAPALESMGDGGAGKSESRRFGMGLVGSAFWPWPLLGDTTLLRP